ncbi:hypothetical protein [Streptomyces sp. NPDC021020]|uniref:hypothetical protein n=1 Tax=Streptomyces sp. NPDC021020 TaxID=3365109 RepID=UPI0037A1CBC0
MPKPPFNLGLRSGTGLRMVLGGLVLLVLLVGAGLAAYFTRDGRSPAKPATAPRSSSPSPDSSAQPGISPTPRVRGALPVPPATHDPIVYAKAAAVALWSYDTRAHPQSELVAGLHRWLTSEKKYADTASVDALVPSPVLWKEMAGNGQYATATANEAHFPASFTRALQADPGAITTAYVYAVTVTGHQSIAWDGAPHGGAESRAVTLAVQCRPSLTCSLVGVLPNVAP